MLFTLNAIHYISRFYRYTIIYILEPMFRQRTPKTKRQRDVQSAKTNNGKIVTQTEVVDGAKGMKVERIGLLGGEGEGWWFKGG